MSKIKEIHRLIELNLSECAIARALIASRNTDALARMLSIPDEQEPRIAEVASKKGGWAASADRESIHREFRAGTTLTILWQEQVENGVGNVQYPAFWKHFSKRFSYCKQSVYSVFSLGSRK